ncbi:alpha/beta fold hydrolase [Alkalimarinus alittae]|uniref:Alpha/beta fold hydrolase n=1 Tax=Alkalimarinus alittae TaxID=2961619 RepID=A0ABY6N1I8_9ALTE|nr:alpha/beta fold hydrolase [Alkalimarinus alittae]UZE95981.1 alpha/beta fold hydrolase [Alkalimarinus alittae]
MSGQGEPIVLVHGLFGSLENLGMIARGLSDQYEVHAIDVRNHGRSPHSDVHTYEAISGDIIGYLDSCGITRCHFLGHSMGGKAVMHLALNFPERVNKLIVADIAPVKYEPHHNEIFEGLLSLPLTELQSRGEADQLLAKTVKTTAVRQFLLKNLVKNGNSGFSWKMNLKSLCKNYQHIMAGQSSKAPFDGEVLFIAGGKSNYIQRQHREHVLQLFPNIEMKIIPDTGHWLHAEKPELFVRICERFLDLKA